MIAVHVPARGRFDRLLAAGFVLTAGLIDAACTYVLIAAGLGTIGIPAAIVAIPAIVVAGRRLDEETAP